MTKEFQKKNLFIKGLSKTEYFRNYRKIHREKIREQAKTNYYKNLTQKRAYYKSYAQKHPELRRAYYNRHRIQEKARTKENLRKRKEYFVAQKGGKCSICGYFKNLSALEFHHEVPLRKEMRKRDKFENTHSKWFDLTKVILICSNCHKELHNPQLLRKEP